MAKTALVADDDEYFRLALERLLREKLGFGEVIEAASFDGAIERLEETDGVSLAIFDLAMPGIDSPAALRTVRDSFNVGKLAVVSASRDRGDVLRSLGAGAHGFVSKGDGIRELASALETILDGRIYVPQALAELDSGTRSEANDGPRRVGRVPRRLQLTRRQRDVLELLVAGKTNREIGEALGLRPGTIKVHLAGLFRALGVTNRTAAGIAGTRLLGYSAEADAHLATPLRPRAVPTKADEGAPARQWSTEAAIPGE